MTVGADASKKKKKEKKMKNQHYNQDFTVFTTDAEARRQYVYDLLLCHMHRQHRSVTGSAPQAGPDKVRTRMG